MSKRQIQTVTALATKMGRDKSSVSRWIARDDWPFGRGPWKASIVGEVQAWMAGHLQDRCGDDPEADRELCQWLAREYPDTFGPAAMREMEQHLVTIIGELRAAAKATKERSTPCRK